MFLRIFFGLIIAAIGFGMTKKPNVALDFIGPVNFAEKAFSGGSISFFRLLGVIIILVGFLVITNLHEAFFVGTFNFLFGK